MQRFQKLSGAEFMQTSCWIYALVPNSISKRSWYLRTARIQQYLIQECLQSAPPLRRAPLMECWELALTDRQTTCNSVSVLFKTLQLCYLIVWTLFVCGATVRSLLCLYRFYPAMFAFYKFRHRGWEMKIVWLPRSWMLN